MNKATGEPPELSMFRDDEDLARFVEVAVQTHAVAFTVLQRAAVATLDPAQAGLLLQLVPRMIGYLGSRLIGSSKDGPARLAAIDREADLLWPVLQDLVDAHLTTARMLGDALLPVDRDKAH
jgi:hypothetical protein